MKTDAKRTSAGLRELLFEMIDGVRAGTVDEKTARTIATLCQSILKSVEVELEFRAQALRGDFDGKQIGDLELTSLPAPEKTVTTTGPRFIAGRAASGGR